MAGAPRAAGAGLAGDSGSAPRECSRYDLVLAQGGVYRLVETKARARLSLGDLHNYVFKHDVTGELRFNVDYFIEKLRQAAPIPILQSGNLEIEIYLNSPQSARLAQKLLAQLGGTTAKYEYPEDSGNFYTVQILITAVHR